MEVTQKLVRHWGITRGVGFPILTYTHPPCGNMELSSEHLDLLYNLQRWHPSSVKMICSFGGHSQVGQAMRNYTWRWVPHPLISTSTQWEHGNCYQNIWISIRTYRGGIHLWLRLYVNNFIWGSLTSWPGIGELRVALGSPSLHVHTYPVGTGNCHQNVWICFRTYRGGIHLQLR